MHGEGGHDVLTVGGCPTILCLKINVTSRSNELLRDGLMPIFDGRKKNIPPLRLKRSSRLFKTLAEVRLGKLRFRCVTRCCSRRERGCWCFLCEYAALTGVCVGFAGVRGALASSSMNLSRMAENDLLCVSGCTVSAGHHTNVQL